MHCPGRLGGGRGGGRFNGAGTGREEVDRSPRVHRVSRITARDGEGRGGGGKLNRKK